MTPPLQVNKMVVLSELGKGAQKTFLFLFKVFLSLLNYILFTGFRIIFRKGIKLHLIVGIHLHLSIPIQNRFYLLFNLDEDVNDVEEDTRDDESKPMKRTFVSLFTVLFIASAASIAKRRSPASSNYNACI